MLNISIQGEKLILDKGFYFVIDGLYLNDVRDYMQSKEQKKHLSFDELKMEAFPYVDTPFTIIEIDKNTEFDIRSVQKVEYERSANCTDRYLSTDTGLLLFIKKEILVDFVEQYDFEKLVDMDPIDTNYWSSIKLCFNDNDIGIVISPGANSSYEIDGGGLYKIL